MYQRVGYVSQASRRQSKCSSVLLLTITIFIRIHIFWFIIETFWNHKTVISNQSFPMVILPLHFCPHLKQPLKHHAAFHKYIATVNKLKCPDMSTPKHSHLCLAEINTFFIPQRKVLPIPANICYLGSSSRVFNIECTICIARICLEQRCWDWSQDYTGKVFYPGHWFKHLYLLQYPCSNRFWFPEGCLTHKELRNVYGLPSYLSQLARLRN